MNPSLPLPLDVKLMNLTSTMLLAGFMLLALVDGGRWLAQHPVFAIRGVTVLGDVSHISAASLRAQILPQLSGTFLTVDVNRVRQAFESVPWVRRAVVQREFPNRLRVLLQEHHAVAYWGEDGESTLVNSQGEVFEANPGEVDQDALPRLDGPLHQSARVLAMHRALQPEFEQHNLRIELLSLSTRGNWQAQLDGGALIELGSGSQDEVLGRTRQFLATVGQVAAHHMRSLGALESADLRYAQGYAVRLQGVSTQASPDAGRSTAGKRR